MKLDTRVRRALRLLAEVHPGQLTEGRTGGAGLRNLAALVRLGFAEAGFSERYEGRVSWRISAHGWRFLGAAAYAGTRRRSAATGE